MSNTTAQRLSRTTAATFEELALLFPEATLSEAQQAQALDVATAVAFRGPLTGRLVLRASGCVLPTLASNMLGDHGAPASLQRDALGELANVICGNLMPEIGGTAAVFHLSAPVALDASDDHRPAPDAQAVFGVEDGRVEASLYLHAAADAVVTGA